MITLTDKETWTIALMIGREQKKLGGTLPKIFKTIQTKIYKEHPNYETLVNEFYGMKEK